MHKTLIASLLCALSLGAAQAATVVDQNAPTNNAYMAQFAQTSLAQSFKQSTGNIVGAGIFLQQGQGTSGNVTISLYDALPNAGGNLLASGTAFGSNGSWVDVFWSLENIVAETTYFLVFTSDNNSMGIAGDTANGYSRGQVYANGGYGSFPSFDYTFRTYAEDDVARVSEPSQLALLGLGLMAAGGLSRRRRSA